ncbi:hypothetical protein F4558_001272 [Micromonospora profundi]|nr:hypothetical protein [Micromonospora profundi]
MPLLSAGEERLDVCRERRNPAPHGKRPVHYRPETVAPLNELAEVLLRAPTRCRR